MILFKKQAHNTKLAILARDIIEISERDDNRYSWVKYWRGTELYRTAVVGTVPELMDAVNKHTEVRGVL